MNTQSCDVLIVGGGIMGVSTAYNLIKLEPGLRVMVVERDFSYERSSTTLSIANIRTIAFSLDENVLLSLETLKILKNLEAETAVGGRKPFISFREEGNLVLADPSGLREARRIYQRHKRLGSTAWLMEPADIAAQWPMFNMENIAGGAFGRVDGHLDAHSLLMAYKNKGRELGVIFFEDEVIGLTVEKDVAVGAGLASGDRITAGITVNCTGAWAAEVLETAGIHIPVIPVRRQVFALDTKVKYDPPLPLVFHPTGLWFRSETGGLILAGKAMDEDPVGFDFDWQEERFMEVIWPELAAFIPAFEELRLVRGWAGLYEENTLDHNAIIGPWPGIEGLFVCNGFSGHGMMQGPAVGRHMAELITGRRPTMDLSVFSPRRILDNRPVGESGRF